MDALSQPLTFGTAGLLFPAMTVLMLGYANRFIGLAGVARQLAQRHREAPRDELRAQMASMGERLSLMRHMQAMGVVSLLFCTISVVALFAESHLAARASFAAALFFMLASLALSLREIHLSVRALEIELHSLNPGA